MARICQQVRALPIIEHRSASILFAGGGATSPAMRPSRWLRATVRTQGRGPPTQAVHISIVRRMSLLRNTFEVIRRGVSGTARKLACCLRTFVTHGAVTGSNRVTEGHGADGSVGREAAAPVTRSSDATAKFDAP